MKLLCHDPRTSSDPAHKIETENPALQAAEMARQMFPDRDVDWPAIAAAADKCDAPARLEDLDWRAKRCSSCSTATVRAAGSRPAAIASPPSSSPEQIPEPTSASISTH